MSYSISNSNNSVALTQVPETLSYLAGNTCPQTIRTEVGQAISNVFQIVYEDLYNKEMPVKLVEKLVKNPFDKNNIKVCNLLIQDYQNKFLAVQNPAPKTVEVSAVASKEEKVEAQASNQDVSYWWNGMMKVISYLSAYREGASNQTMESNKAAPVVEKTEPVVQNAEQDRLTKEQVLTLTSEEFVEALPKLENYKRALSYHTEEARDGMARVQRVMDSASKLLQELALAELQVQHLLLGDSLSEIKSDLTSRQQVVTAEDKQLFQEFEKLSIYFRPGENVDDLKDPAYQRFVAYKSLEHINREEKLYFNRCLNNVWTQMEQHMTAQEGGASNNGNPLSPQVKRSLDGLSSKFNLNPNFVTAAVKSKKWENRLTGQQVLKEHVAELTKEGAIPKVLHDVKKVSQKLLESSKQTEASGQLTTQTVENLVDPRLYAIQSLVENSAFVDQEFLESNVVREVVDLESNREKAREAQWEKIRNQAGRDCYSQHRDQWVAEEFIDSSSLDPQTKAEILSNENQ